MRLAAFQLRPLAASGCLQIVLQKPLPIGALSAFCILAKVKNGATSLALMAERILEIHGSKAVLVNLPRFKA